MQAQSYIHLQVHKQYIALNSETYLSIRQQELTTCKRIGYKFYSKLTIYFTVNMSFVNYLDEFPNLTESLEFWVVKERTKFEQTHFIEYF